MVITEEPVQTINAYIIRVYASYYIITNENAHEDHGEEDNRNAFEWAQDAYINPTDTDLYIPEPSTNSDFEACWTIAAYEAQEDAEEALYSVNDWLNQDVPAHIRAYHAVVEQHEVELEEPIIQENPDHVDQQIQEIQEQDEPQEDQDHVDHVDHVIQENAEFDSILDDNQDLPHFQPHFQRSISLPIVV